MHDIAHKNDIANNSDKTVNIPLHLGSELMCRKPRKAARTPMETVAQTSANFKKWSDSDMSFLAAISALYLNIAIFSNQISFLQDKQNLP